MKTLIAGILLTTTFTANAGNGGAMPRENKPLFERFGACAALLGTVGQETRADILLRQAFELAKATAEPSVNTFLTGVSFGSATLVIRGGEDKAKAVFHAYSCGNLTGASA